MKQITLIILTVLFVAGLYAVDFEISGENRVRAAVYNDSSETDGAHVDNRFNIGFDSQFHKNLSFRVAAEIGNVVWGDTGGALGTAAAIHFNEINFNYYIDAMDANIIVGQQYWADRMALMMDDYFSGVLLQKKLTGGTDISTEFAWMKARNNNNFVKDDYDVFMAHAMLDQPNPIGMYLFFGNDDVADYLHVSVMPYIGMEMDIISLDATVFVDMQMDTKNEVGFGGAMKATMEMDLLELGMDLLVASKNGVTTISPWYQNGLYIYGIGKHHDGLNLYWNTPYDDNTDFFASAVGKVRAQVSEELALFGAFGYLMDLGMELNAGLEYELIPDLMKISGFGAFGLHDNDTKNYAIGTTVKIEF